MLSIIVWVTFGALVGWIASLLLKTDEVDQNVPANLAASVIGAVIGGALASIFGFGGLHLTGGPPGQTVLFAGIGAMAALLAANFAHYRSHHHEIP